MVSKEVSRAMPTTCSVSPAVVVSVAPTASVEGKSWRRNPSEITTLQSVPAQGPSGSASARPRRIGRPRASKKPGDTSLARTVVDRLSDASQIEPRRIEAGRRGGEDDALGARHSPEHLREA